MPLPLYGFCESDAGMSRSGGMDLADGGEAAKPAQLYDPTHRLLAQVFAGESVFPAGAFATTGWLRVPHHDPSHHGWGFLHAALLPSLR